MRTKHNLFKRLVAIALVLVSLLQWLPADLIQAAVAPATTKNTYIPGDVNGDLCVNAKDVTLVRQYVAGKYDVGINTLAADVNADGDVDAKDVNNLRQYIAGGYGVELKPGLERFTVSFVTGSGSEMADKIVLEGTLISSLATPYWAEHIFLGWYYDPALTQLVGSEDKVTNHLTLYAGWLEQAPLDALDTVNFASAVDADPNFTIQVLANDPEMTAEDVLAAIQAQDLSNPDAKDIIVVTGSDGSFTISGGESGFRKGGTYRITLLSDKLTFKDQPASARDYNITIDREEVMNLTMKGDIKYLPVNVVSNITNNGQSVASLDLALYQANKSGVTVADLSTGSFVYNGVLDVKEGDIVCIYDGEIPTNRTNDTPKEQLGDMAYLEITGVSGNTFTYVSAEAEDVVFTPDMLPMPESADLDGNASTITVENKYLDYSPDVYSYVNLDSQTTVDVGDFLIFYTGEYGVQSGENAAVLTGYGKVVSVNVGAETTVITYVEVSWADVESCMDVHTEEEMTAAELLEGMDTENMESEIEQQAMDSGFANEAAMYMASLALATDNFNALSKSMDLDDYKVTLSDGKPVSPEQLQLMSNGGVEVEIEDVSVKATISKKPTHLGNIEGK